MADFKDKCVLIVEDNELNIDLMSEILKSLGCPFEVAKNGLEADEMYQKKKIDLVFMDLLMPECDGYEAAQKIRAFERGQDGKTRVPIVAVTADVSSGVESSCQLAGMNEVMHKPVPVASIKAAIDKYLG